MNTEPPQENVMETSITEAPPQQDIAALLIARTPGQMVEAQKHMIALADNRLIEHGKELNNLLREKSHAAERKWKTTGYDRLIAREKKTLQYYEKVKAALEAGYCVIPDVPLDIFAVRVKRFSPDRAAKTDAHDNEAQSDLPAKGEGRYVGDKVELQLTRERQVDGQGRQIRGTEYKAFRFDDEVGFPMMGVKPVVMDATHEAMKQMIFDEIGALPGSPQGSNRRERGNALAAPTTITDPIVVGRIIDPRSQRASYSRRKHGVRNGLSFLIAWWFRPEDM